MASSSGKVKKPGERRGAHPNSRKNLVNSETQWPPGQTGNPKGQSLKQRLEMMMAKPEATPPPDAPLAEHFVFQTIKQGLSGQPSQNKEIWRRHDGEVAQPITGENGEPIRIVIEGVKIGASGGGKPFRDISEEKATNP